MGRRHVAALIAVLAAFVIAGLAIFAGQDSDDTDDLADPQPSPSFPIIAPGRPGEPAVQVSPGEVVAREEAFNSHDADFLRMMIPHHEQALEMAELAPTRAKSPQVKAFAERIRLAQAGEIEMFKGWLADRGLGPTVTGHNHADMPGMQSPEAMRSLAAASGEEFDRLFLEMMIDHHQGAIDMAKTVLTLGINPRIEEIATSIAHEQAVEIDRMRTLLG